MLKMGSGIDFNAAALHFGNELFHVYITKKSISNQDQIIFFYHSNIESNQPLNLIKKLEIYVLTSS